MEALSIADARARLPELVREAESGKAIELTRRGEPVAVLIGRKQYDRLVSRRRRFSEAWNDFVREVDLAALNINPDEYSVACAIRHPRSTLAVTRAATHNRSREGPPMKRILIAGIVGGIIMFVWSAVMHMSPVGRAGLKTLPNEDAVRTALKNNIADEGLYYFPGPDPANPKDMKAWEAKMRSGPTGLLVYAPVGEPMTPRQLTIELLSDIAAALIAAILASMLVGSYGKRVAAITMLAVFAWVLLTVSYWNWYHFPAAFVLAELFIETVGMFLAGLFIAKYVPRPA